MRGPVYFVTAECHFHSPLLLLAILHKESKLAHLENGRSVKSSRDGTTGSVTFVTSHVGVLFKSSGN